MGWNREERVKELEGWKERQEEVLREIRAGYRKVLEELAGVMLARWAKADEEHAARLARRFSGLMLGN